MNFLYSITHTNCTTNNERTDSMICKNCNAYNDSRANFCCKCGGELYHSTMVTSPVTDKVTAYSIPTMGVRAFSGMGNGYLQSAIQNVVSDDEKQHNSIVFYIPYATLPGLGRGTKSHNNIVPVSAPDNKHFPI